MSLATLLNIPNTERSLLTFSFSNADQHNLIINGISSRFNLNLNRYVLDPIPASDFKTWLQIHQQMHNDMNAVLGIDGVDLTAVDFRDEEQASSWVRLHLNEHVLAAQALGLP